MASLMAATPLQNPSRSRLDRQAPRSGPAQCSEPASRGGAGRTDANRAHVSSPSNVATTTHRPAESRAAGSDVRSRRPAKSRPPTTPTAGSSGTFEAYGRSAPAFTPVLFVAPTARGEWIQEEREGGPEPTLGAGPRYPAHSHGPLARAGRSPSGSGRGR